jgi:hypothetical protein
MMRIDVEDLADCRQLVLNQVMLDGSVSGDV